MILTVDKKKKFLMTMIVIMACATAINYGLYNVLSTYLNTDNDDDTQNDIYYGIQLNIIIVLIIIAVVTVIMVILIPKENVMEMMNRLDANNSSNNNGTVLTEGSGGSKNLSLGLSDSVGTDYDKELDDMVDEDIEEGLDIGEKK